MRGMEWDDDVRGGRYFESPETRRRYLSSSSISFGMAFTSSEPSWISAEHILSPTNKISDTLNDKKKEKRKK